MAREKGKFESCRVYRGRGNAVAELKFEYRQTRRPQYWWWVRQLGSRLWFGPFKGDCGKLHALNYFANACGRSGAAMDWQPIV